MIGHKREFKSIMRYIMKKNGSLRRQMNENSFPKKNKYKQEKVVPRNLSRSLNGFKEGYLQAIKNMK